jgi:alanine racemase
VSELPGLRPVWGEVDLGAIRANVEILLDAVAPAQLLAVVKADGYGHGSIPVARAALAAGAQWLGVALVEEGVTLREAGITAPILMLSEPPLTAAAAVVENGLTPVVYTRRGIEALAVAANESDISSALAVHLKIDTGMHRVGCTPSEAPELIELISSLPGVTLGGLCTHLANADDLQDSYTDDQIAVFEKVLEGVADRPDLIHAANSAGAIAHPSTRFNLVRAGIAMYGVAPSLEVSKKISLLPALSLHARVAFVHRLSAGAKVSYGSRYELKNAATIVTVPIGYADGVPRSLGLTGGEVLINARRYPLAGTVTMDQCMVDVGDDEIAVGDEVVLLGRQGNEEITAQEWADRLAMIPWEVVTGIGPRVPRRYRGEV